MSLERVFEEAASALWPLEGSLASAEGLERLFNRLGYATPATSLVTVVSSLKILRDALVALDEDGLKLLQGKPTLADYLAFGKKVAPVITEASKIGDAVRQGYAAIPASIGMDLLDLLIVAHLAERHPVVYRLLVLLGIIEQRPVAANSGDPDGRELDYIKITVHWQRIATLFKDPAGLGKDVYGWGTATFDSDLVLVRMQALVAAIGIEARLDEVSGNALTKLRPSAAGAPTPPLLLRTPIYVLEADVGRLETGLELLRVEGKTGASDDGLGLMPYAMGSLALTLPLTETVVLTITGSAAIEGGLAFTLRPSGFGLEAKLTDPASIIQDVKIELAKVPASGATAIVLLGRAEGTRLEATKLLLALGGNAKDFYIAGGATGLRAVIDTSGDGLLGTLLPKGALVEVGDILIGWRPSRGIYFESGAGLRVVLPVNIDLEVLKITQIEAKIGFEPDLHTSLSVDAKLTVGPLFLAAEGLGLGVHLKPTPQGSFGSFDVTIGLLVPHGYAANLAAGPIKGGGSISVTDDGYRGALALQFETFGFSAFAILTTKLPGGAPGYSFLASIFGQFEIQLGYGFKLTGLGGVIGVDRSINVEQLRSTLRAGNLDGLLFPANPIQDAARILNDLAAAFPPQAGRYVVGPMVRIAWGTPTLIEGKLGVILELGGALRIVILGQISAMLPKPDDAVVVLKIDFLGVIDFGARTIGLDATLQNSRILEWPISGDMALRTGWGPGADFVLSVGGFHPQFAPPPSFPTLRRLSINFGSDNPRITLAAYMALTTNTVQMGAHLDLYAKGPKIPILGQFTVDGNAYFDCLVQFNPFYFDVALGLGLSLYCDGSCVCSIGGDLRLTGPNPYHIKGKVWAEVLGQKVKVPLDRTFGDPQPEAIEHVDALVVLQAAVAESRNWSSVPPSTRSAGVSLSVGTSSATLVIDPLGGLRFSQNALPLGIPIDKVGTALLANDLRTFDVRAVDAQGAPLPAKSVQSKFAYGQFFNMTESQRLSAPAGQPAKSGVELADASELAFEGGAIVQMEYDYETISLVTDEGVAKTHPSFKLPAEAWMRWMRGGVLEMARPRVPGFVDPRLERKIAVSDPALIVISDKANARGLLPVGVDGASLSGAHFGQLRELAPAGRIASSVLADPRALAGPQR